MPVQTRSQSHQQRKDSHFTATMVDRFRFDKVHLSFVQKTHPMNSPIVRPKRRRLNGVIDRECNGVSGTINTNDLTYDQSYPREMKREIVQDDTSENIESEDNGALLTAVPGSVKSLSAKKVKKGKQQVTIEEIEECASHCIIPENFYTVWNGMKNIH